MELVNAFGKTFLDHLALPALVIGKDQWSRSQLATDLSLSNPVAAGKVTKYCRDHRIRDTKHLYDHSSPYSFAGERGIGLTTLYVVWQAFRAKGLNPAKWYEKGEKGAVHTFSTYKRREHLAALRTTRKRSTATATEPSKDAHP